MTPAAPTPLDQIRFGPLGTQVQPGERCIATLLDVPGGATIAWSVGGAEAVAEGPLDGPSIVLRFRPEVIELVPTAPSPVDARIVARVTLGGITRMLEATVGVLPLRVPSMLALFRNRAFSAADNDIPSPCMPSRRVVS